MKGSLGDCRYIVRPSDVDKTTSERETKRKTEEANASQPEL